MFQVTDTVGSEEEEGEVVEDDEDTQEVPEDTQDTQDNTAEDTQSTSMDTSQLNSLSGSYSSSSVSIALGTPVHKKTVSKAESLPRAELWQKDIIEHIPYENLPGATGNFDRMNVLLADIKSKRKSTSFSSGKSWSQAGEYKNGMPGAWGCILFVLFISLGFSRVILVCLLGPSHMGGAF